MADLPPRTRTLRDGTAAVVRSGRACDADAIHELARLGTLDEHTVVEAHESLATPETRAKDLTAAAADPQQLWLIAEHQGALLGELSFQAPKLRRIAHRGRMSILVDPNWRGRGVGELLIRTLLEWAETHPLVEKIRLGVLSTNPGAIRLYTRLGFTEECRRPREFKLPGNRYADDILMTRYVKAF